MGSYTTYSYRCQVCSNTANESTSGRHSQADLRQNIIKTCVLCKQIMCKVCSREDFCKYCFKEIPRLEKEKYKKMINWEKKIIKIWIGAVALTFLIGLTIKPDIYDEFTSLFLSVVGLGWVVQLIIRSILTRMIQRKATAIAFSIKEIKPERRDGYGRRFQIPGELLVNLDEGGDPSFDPRREPQNFGNRVYMKEMMRHPLELHEQVQIFNVKKTILKMYQQRPNDYISISEIGMESGNIDVDVVRSILEKLIENFDITAKFDASLRKIKIFKIF